MLKLSEVFKVRSLAELVENFYINLLKSKDEIKVALAYLKLAARNQLDNLKKECYHVIRKNKQILICTAAWNEFLENNPRLLLEVFDDESDEANK